MTYPRETHAVVSDPAIAHRFEIRSMPVAAPRDHEAIVAVRSFSLNAGEVRIALASDNVTRPGSDLAGVVHHAAADGNGPPEGTRVVGLSLHLGAWARYATVPGHALAAIPDDVGFGAASTLPVAGLTALHALAKGGLLLGKSVLVTGASGGVGRFACRLAVLSGARVTALLRSDAAVQALRDDGVQDVVVGNHDALEQRGSRYALVLESVGGSSLGRSLMLLERGGSCVVCGNSAKEATTFGSHAFYHQGGVAMLGLYLFTEHEHIPAARGLALLVELMREHKLRPAIELEASWTRIAEVAARYHARGIHGKAVLHVDD
jgi:NADPH2:quinone reductase